MNSAGHRPIDDGNNVRTVKNDQRIGQRILATPCYDRYRQGNEDKEVNGKLTLVGG